MTITYGIDHVSANSTESVTVLIAEKSTMTFSSVKTDPKTGRITTTYLIGSGDANHPAYVVYIADPVSPGVKTRYGSVTIQTWATQTDSVTGIETWWPIQATTSFVITNGSPVQLADFNKLVAAVFSQTYASVASGVRDTAWVQNLLFGNPTVK
jgi:hypothetical protein